MRVVHIATVDVEGGAARAAFRLHQGLRAAGVDSSMLVHKKASSDPAVVRGPGPEADDQFFWGLIQRYYIGARRTPVSNTFFSSSYPGVDLSGAPQVREADVLQLHWVAGYQPAPAVARLLALGKPVVWTLHDQRPFTGGCHFSAGCGQYSLDCARCPQLEAGAHPLPAALLADARQALAPSRLTLVAPSRWLAECARHSALFAETRVETIPYGIETDRYQPRDRSAVRARLGLPADGFQILFGADYGGEKRKGFEVLIEALKLCLEQPGFRRALEQRQIGLMAFGRPNPELSRLPVPIRFFGYVDSDAALADIYAAADLFLLPSLEDNLPNTVLEAMSCGTPALAFNVGGLPDLIVDGVTGQLLPPGQAQAFAAALTAAAADPGRCAQWRAASRQRALDHFSLALQARRYADLYQRLLREPACGSFSPLASPLPAASAPGPHFESLHSQVLQESLADFSRDLKHATAAQRQTCSQLIATLRDAKAGVGSAEIRRLQAALGAAERERQQRLTQRREKRAARRQRFAALLDRCLPWRRGTPAAGLGKG